MNRIAFIIFLTLGFSCSDSSSVDDSVMTFEVTMFSNLPIEEFANNPTNRFYPVTITLTDYEPESEFSGTVNIFNIGLLSIGGDCGGGLICFWVSLDSTYFPIETLYFSDLTIDNLQMKGRFGVGGSTIDTGGNEFIAVKRE